MTLFKAIELLSEVPLTLDNIQKARDIVMEHKIVPTDLDLAIKRMETLDIDGAKKYIYGPSNRGSGLGVIKDIIEIVGRKT